MTQETITGKYRINWSFSNICLRINALNWGCSESQATRVPNRGWKHRNGSINQYAT